MFYMDYEVDRSVLLSKSDILDYLEENGPNDRTLARLRTEMEATLGFDPTWHCYASDGSTTYGFSFLPVKEGFLYLPFSEVTLDEGEIYDTTKGRLLDAEMIRWLYQAVDRHAREMGRAFLDAKSELEYGDLGEVS